MCIRSHFQRAWGKYTLLCWPAIRTACPQSHHHHLAQAHRPATIRDSACRLILIYLFVPELLQWQERHRRCCKRSREAGGQLCCWRCWRLQEHLLISNEVLKITGVEEWVRYICLRVMTCVSSEAGRDRSLCLDLVPPNIPTPLADECSPWDADCTCQVSQAHNGNC